jgi:hypothetical protein
VETGRVLFQAKGCAGCHQGRLSLENRTPRSTMADLLAILWNHSLPRAEDRQPLSYDEMSGLVRYLCRLRGAVTGAAPKVASLQ